MRKIGKMLVGILLISILSLSIKNMTLAAGITYYRYKGFVYTDDDGLCYGGVTITDYKGKKKKVTVPVDIYGEKVRRVAGLKNAKKLKEIHLPKTIRDVSLVEAPALKKVTIDSQNKILKVENNLIVNKKGTELISAPGGIKKVKIHDKIQIITSGAFYEGLVKSVTLGKNVRIIESSAFGGCKNLTTIKLNQKLKIIDDLAFEKCKNLKKITIPKNVKEIGVCCFARCESLKRVVIENKRKAPQFYSSVFDEARKGIKFYVPNKKVAKQLKENLSGTRVKEADIYVKEKCIYENVTGTEEA